MKICVFLLIVIGLFLLAVKKKRSSGSYDGDVEVYSESVAGDRDNQQDYCIFPENLHTEEIKNSGMLAIVCDGMGGMENGEKASRCCAETVYRGYYRTGSSEKICALLEELIVKADKEVSSLTSDDGRRLRSGTTIVAAVYLNSKIYWASVGDSRIYLYHKGELIQITRDHNYRQKLLKDLEDGLISGEQFASAKQKEALISYVGMGKNIMIDTGELSFSENCEDILLLCSDGIYKTASESIIRKTIEKTHSFEELPGALVDAAMSGEHEGTRDNISVIVIKRK